MISLKQLEENTQTDDIAFKYRNKQYFIFFFGKTYIAGEYGIEDDNLFDTFEEMTNNWIIEGQSLKKIVNEIELL